MTAGQWFVAVVFVLCLALLAFLCFQVFFLDGLVRELVARIVELEEDKMNRTAFGPVIRPTPTPRPLPGAYDWSADVEDRRSDP